MVLWTNIDLRCFRTSTQILKFYVLYNGFVLSTVYIRSTVYYERLNSAPWNENLIVFIFTLNLFYKEENTLSVALLWRGLQLKHHLHHTTTIINNMLAN